MRILTILFISLLCAGSLFGQGLKKYPVGNSGCSAYFYCDPGTFALDKSPDSSEVYTAECEVNNDSLTYGIICVKLTKEASVKDMQASEDLLSSYLDYLKTSLNIITAVGYGKGQRLNNNENTRGIIDYWKDKDGFNWKVKAWTDGKVIGVLYVLSKNGIPETKVNVFLNGFVLPE